VAVEAGQGIVEPAALTAKIDKLAQDLRAYVRKRAGLAPDWDLASEDMRNFYCEHARRIHGDDA
jgi:hypothetical protein